MDAAFLAAIGASTVLPIWALIMRGAEIIGRETLFWVVWMSVGVFVVSMTGLLILTPKG